MNLQLLLIVLGVIHIIIATILFVKNDTDRKWNVTGGVIAGIAILCFATAYVVT